MMCAGISLSWRELPESLIERYGLHDRVVIRNNCPDREIRFLYRDPRPLIPAWHGEQLGVFPWGNRDRRSKLPRTGWVRLESLEAGHWSHRQPEAVEIPATLGLEKGVWFKIREGIRGILVRDECERPHVYMLTETASHYYSVMTRAKRMPVFVGERI